MATLLKTEPTMEAASTSQDSGLSSPSPAVQTQLSAGPPVAAPAAADHKLDQLSRVEDKTARIEEKFARSEERMMRLESALEKATIRLEGATQDMNLQGVRDDLARVRDQVSRKPGGATILAISLLAALVGAALAYALMRYGVPGLIPPAGPR
jgi:septal ring factor EnvC (AmiA/AmiB activator)